MRRFGPTAALFGEQHLADLSGEWLTVIGDHPGEFGMSYPPARGTVHVAMQEDPLYNQH